MTDLNPYFWRKSAVILATLWFLLWRWQVVHASWTPATAVSGFTVRTQEVDQTQWRTVEQYGACAAQWQIFSEEQTWSLKPYCQRRQHVTFQIIDRTDTSLLAFSSSEMLSHQATLFGSGWVSLLVEPQQEMRLRAEGALFSPSQIGMVLVQEPGEGPDFDPEPYATNLGNWQLYPGFSDGALGTENCHSLSALFQPRQEWPCRFGSSDGLTRQKPP